MSCEKDWVDITAALLTPVIAIVGTTIAVLQWKLNKVRLRHELFEKRYAIFEATNIYLSSLITHAAKVEKDRISFLRNTKGVFVLFDKKIVDYLDELHKKSLQLHLHAQRKDHDKESEVLLWLSEQIEKIDIVFKGQLKLNKSHITRRWRGTLLRCTLHSFNIMCNKGRCKTGANELASYWRFNSSLVSIDF